MYEMSVTDFLSAAKDAPAPLVVLVDVAASTEETLRVAYDCTTGWLALPTSAIESISIIDYVFCENGQSYHKVAIVLKNDDARKIVSPIRSLSEANRSDIGGRQPFDFPRNVGFYPVNGAEPGALAIAFDSSGSGLAVGLAWVPSRSR